jgi:hypothetical protein
MRSLIRYVNSCFQRYDIWNMIVTFAVFILSAVQNHLLNNHQLSEQLQVCWEEVIQTRSIDSVDMSQSF